MVTFAAEAKVTIAPILMNTRDYKLFRSDQCYHVYNRGDNKELIFKEPQDYYQFAKRIKMSLGILPVFNSGLRIKPLPPESFTILSFCLMPNHFHFLIRQNTDLPVGQLINRVTNSYAKFFNAKYSRVGNLFQDTFKAKHVANDSYLTYLSSYIHNNPTSPFEYEFSSLPDFLGTRQGKLCDPRIILRYFNNNPESYKKFVENYSLQMYSQIQHLAFDEN